MNVYISIKVGDTLNVRDIKFGEINIQWNQYTYISGINDAEAKQAFLREERLYVPCWL